MLTTKDLEKYIKNKIYSTLPDLNVEKSLNFCVAPDKICNEGKYVYAQYQKYHYVNIEIERSIITTHQEFSTEDDLLYALLCSILFPVVIHYAQENTPSGKDFRRSWFNKEIELFSKFGKEFKERKSAEIEEILREHPYHDKS